MRHKVEIPHRLTSLWVSGLNYLPVYQLRAEVEAWVRQNVKGPMKLCATRQAMEPGWWQFVPHIRFGRAKDAVLFKMRWC